MPVLENSPADVVRWLLVQLGAGSDPAANQPWPVHAAGEPSTPDEVITVYDTAWQDDGRGMPTGEKYYHYGLQVRVRAADHPTCWNKTSEVLTVMNEVVYANLVDIPATAQYGAGEQYHVDCIAKSTALVLGKNVPTTKLNVCVINGVVSLRPLTPTPTPTPPPLVLDCEVCPAGAPQQWQVTISGATGEAAVLNGTWTLTHTTGCEWRQSDASAGPFPALWLHWIGVGTSFGLYLFTSAGHSLFFDNAGWACTSPNTMFYNTGASEPSGTWPSTLTVIPAGGA